MSPFRLQVGQSAMAHPWFKNWTKIRPRESLIMIQYKSSRGRRCMYLGELNFAGYRRSEIFQMYADHCRHRWLECWGSAKQLRPTRAGVGGGESHVWGCWRRCELPEWARGALTTQTGFLSHLLSGGLSLEKSNRKQFHFALAANKDWQYLNQSLPTRPYMIFWYS